MLLVLLKLVLCCIWLVSAKFEIELQRVEQLYGEDLFDVSNLRVRKYNRTTYSLNGTMNIYEDLDDSYSVAVTAAYSRLGNNQFNEHPYRLAEEPACKWYYRNFREYQYLLTETQSSLPRIPPEGLCPYPKGIYWLKDAVLPGLEEAIPAVTAEGYWRATYLLDGPSKNASFRIYLRLKRVLV